MLKAILADLLNFLGPWVLMALWLGVGYLAVRAIASGGFWLLPGVILAVAFAVPLALTVLALVKIRGM